VCVRLGALAYACVCMSVCVCVCVCVRMCKHTRGIQSSLREYMYVYMYDDVTYVYDDVTYVRGIQSSLLEYMYVCVYTQVQCVCVNTHAHTCVYTCTHAGFRFCSTVFMYFCVYADTERERERERERGRDVCGVTPDNALCFFFLFFFLCFFFGLRWSQGALLLRKPQDEGVRCRLLRYLGTIFIFVYICLYSYSQLVIFDIYI
jgi:hypothetical protein